MPASTNLEALHQIIQAVFGWWSYHLWEFTIKRETHGDSNPPDESWGGKFMTRLIVTWTG